MENDASSYRIATQLIAKGRDPKRYGGLINPPAFSGSTVLFEDVDDFYDKNHPRRYSTRGHLGTDHLQELFLELEGIRGAVVFQSTGLASIVSTLYGLLKPGDHILVSDGIYNPTRKFCDSCLKRYGIEVEYYPPRIKPEELKTLFKSNTRLLYLESPSSQSFEMQDIPGLARLGQEHKVITVLDNTWSAGFFFKAFNHGVDFVIYSLTKYHMGHANGLMGAVVCEEKNKRKLQCIQNVHGQVSGTREVEQVLLGIRTLETRLLRHQASALQVARWLEQQEEVLSVHFPVLPSDHDHELWKRDFTGGAGPFSFCLKGPQGKGGRIFLDQLRLLKLGFSWGGFQSLLIPVEPNALRASSSLTYEGQMYRLHVGLEDPQDIIDDLKRGIEQCQQKL